jgi:spore coat protein H
MYLEYGNPVDGKATLPPSLLTLNVDYQDTAAPKKGPYLKSDKTCDSTLTAAPADSYPAGKVLLSTVNLDEDGDDACVPEIKVKVTSNDGKIVAADAKMRVRGSSTREAEQKSYRIKLDKTAPTWYSEQTLQFNKHPWDLTRVRNKLAFDLMRLIPYHESLRTQFTQIKYSEAITPTPYGNNGDMGLFTHVEKMGDSYLERRGWVAGSNVYKAEDFSFDRTDGLLAATTPDTDVTGFEKLLSLESDSGDHHAIINVVKALEKDEEEAPFADTFAHYFNRNNYLAWLATTILLGNHDTVNQNFGLYQPKGTEKFYFLPWDYDGALGSYGQPGVNYIDTEIMTGIGNWWNVPLHQRFLSDRKNLADLKAAVEEIRSKYLTDANVEKLLSSYRPVVEPLISREPDLSGLATVSGGDPKAVQWRTEFDRLKKVIGINHQKFLESLKRPVPFWVGVTTDKKLSWDWPAPFHPEGKPLTYRVQIAAVTADAFKAGVPMAKDISAADKTSINLSALTSGLNGNYLVRVKASDPDGNWMYNFDHSNVGNAVVFGAVCLKLPSGDDC